jgi:hypothetical protein
VHIFRLPFYGEGLMRVSITHGHPHPLTLHSPHDNPCLAIFADADTEGGGCFVEVAAGGLEPRHNYICNTNGPNC